LKHIYFQHTKEVQCRQLGHIRSKGVTQYLFSVDGAYLRLLHQYIPLRYLSQNYNRNLAE